MASLQRIGQASTGLPSRAPRFVPGHFSRAWPCNGGCSSRITRRYISRFPALQADLVVKVPQMAESISEGTLSTFLKQVGDRIDADDELASIETDKIDVAVNVPEGGVLAELLVEEGDVVTVGQPIARIETGPVAESTTRDPEPKLDEPKPDLKLEQRSSPEDQKHAQPEAAPVQAPDATPQTPTTPASNVQPAQQELYQHEYAPHVHTGPSRVEREVIPAVF